MVQLLSSMFKVLGSCVSLFLIKIYLILCIWYLPIYEPCVCLIQTDARKRALDLLELELQMVVSHHVGAGK